MGRSRNLTTVGEIERLSMAIENCEELNEEEKVRMFQRFFELLS